MTRQLSHSSDAINAFAGVLNVVAANLGTRHHGLPTRKFDGGNAVGN
jgi:hypothetical protein